MSTKKICLLLYTHYVKIKAERRNFLLLRLMAFFGLRYSSCWPPFRTLKKFRRRRSILLQRNRNYVTFCALEKNERRSNKLHSTSFALSMFLCQELLVEPVFAQLCTSYEVRLNAIEPNLKKQLCSDKVYLQARYSSIAANFLMK